MVYLMLQSLIQYCTYLTCSYTIEVYIFNVNIFSIEYGLALSQPDRISQVSLCLFKTKLDPHNKPALIMLEFLEFCYSTVYYIGICVVIGVVDLFRGPRLLVNI